MYAQWPLSLPAPLLGGYEIQLGESLIRTQPGKGPALQKTTTDAVPDPITAQMILDRAQWADLKAFFKVTLVGGSNYFEWLDPLTAEIRVLRFTAGPRAAVSAESPELLRVTLQLEEMP